MNISLVECWGPTLGVVYAPARLILFWEKTVAGEARRATQPHGERGPALLFALTQPTGSGSHDTPETEAWLCAASMDHHLSVRSSLKFVLVVVGEVDVYPRSAPTMECDTAAGDAVLQAAGGVFTLDCRPLGYAEPRFSDPGFLVPALYESAALRPFMRSAQPMEHFQ